MAGVTEQRWKAGWTAGNPPSIDHLVVPRDSRPWQDSWRAGLEQQDLGFAEASGGQFATWRIRANGVAGWGEDWPDRDLDFCWVYMLAGSLELKGPGVTHLVLRSHDAIYIPRGWRPTTYWYSEDCECLEVTAPAQADGGLPAVAKPTAATPIVSIYSPNSFVPLAGGVPRPIFDYRDFEIGPLTDGRVGIVIVRAYGPPQEGGTGKHAHSWGQWNITIAGWYDIMIDGHEPVRLVSGDSTFTPASAPHDVTAYSPDLAILNFIVPAEGKTTEF